MWCQCRRNPLSKNPAQMAEEIAQIFRNFITEAPEGVISGFVILQGPHEDSGLRKTSQETYSDCWAWDWREWNPLLNNPPVGEYFFCLENKDFLGTDQLMAQFRNVVKKDSRAKWRISFQQVGKVDA